MRKSLLITASLILAAAVAPVAAPQAGAAGNPSPTQLVSASSGSPGTAGTDRSMHSAVSENGRYVVFDSFAYGLSDHPRNGGSQVYLRDTVTNTTQMISQASASVAGDGSSVSPTISADGSVVAYSTNSTNIVAGLSGGGFQVLVWSRSSGATVVASVSNDPMPVLANSNAWEVDISADGSAVAFTSSATNLVAADSRGYPQVFKHDLSSRQTSLVSVVESPTPAGVMGGAKEPDISDDGRLVAFTSVGTASSIPGNGKSQVYVRDTESASTVAASYDNASGALALDDSGAPTISSDGSHVAFESKATFSFSPGVLPPGPTVFVRDLAGGTLSPACHNHLGNAIECRAPSLSGDGHTLAFLTVVPAVVEEYSSIPETMWHVYVADLTTGRVRLGDAAPSGTAGGKLDSSDPTISGDGTSVAFTSLSPNLVNPSPPAYSQIYLRRINFADPGVIRISGNDRYSVSAAVSERTNENLDGRARSVFVASGANYADALSGSVRAALAFSPVLLVQQDALPADVESELRRLAPISITILGGESSVGSAVEAKLKSLVPSVYRIAGADRYETAALVSRGQPPAPPVAYIASGENFPDALAGSAAAGHFRGPVLLVRRNDIPISALTELMRLKPGKIVVLGGSDTVSDTVMNGLQSLTAGRVTRISGPDRYSGSAAVSADTFPSGSSIAYVASGEVFPDALSGSAAAIANNGPVLLVRSKSVPDSVGKELDRLRPTTIIVLGGENTVSNAVLDQLKTHLRK